MSFVVSDTELDNIFKAGNTESYYAGLRAVWDAGYESGQNVSMSTDLSQSGVTNQPIDTTPTITTP